MMNTNEIENALRISLGMTPSATPHESQSWQGSLHADLTHRIIGAAIEVHRRVGPGQLESVYQRALACELRYRAIPFLAQAPIAMQYRDECVGDFVADFIVDDRVILELKSVAAFQLVHMAQVLSYLRAADVRLGLLINFNVPVLCRGVRRLIR